MNKKHSRKPEPEHKMRPLDNKQDRGDHDTVKVVKNAKSKAPKDTQVNPEPKLFFDGQNNDAEAKHDYYAENYANTDPGSAEKIRQTNKKIQDMKSYKLKIQHNPYGNRLSEKDQKKIYDKMVKVVEPLDIDKRRRLYRMYTFRKPSEDNTNNEERKDDFTETESPIKSRQTVLTERIHSELPTPASTPTKQKMYLPKPRLTSPVRYKRKPIIKTITTREGGSAKIYKSVSFVERARAKAPLKIQLAPKTVRPARTRSKQQTHEPRTGKSKTSSSHSHSKRSFPSHTDSTAAASKVAHRTSLSSIQKLVMNRACKTRRRRLRYCSPEKAVSSTPVTETAKWAPQSVNDHTKPYYEAWVNTTLAAISNDSEKMQKEKELIVKQMQMKLQYQAAMEMSEDNLSDEKYTGRIVIRR